MHLLLRKNLKIKISVKNAFKLYTSQNLNKGFDNNLGQREAEGITAFFNVLFCSEEVN